MAASPPRGSANHAFRQRLVAVAEHPIRCVRRRFTGEHAAGHCRQRIDVGRRSLRALARVLLERREVGGQGHIVERPVGEPGVEPPERAGVRAAGVRADGGGRPIAASAGSVLAGKSFTLMVIIGNHYRRHFSAGSGSVSERWSRWSRQLTIRAQSGPKT